MIVTVTMNPAIDKTIEIDEIICGGLNRIKAFESDAAGKGINVSKTIKSLGGESIAVGFIGGDAGNTIKNALDAEGIKNDFVKVSGVTRTNTKVFENSGRVTELNEPGPNIKSEDIEKLFEIIEKYASKDTLFVLAGSVPAGVEKTIYRDITEKVHSLGAKVFVDADGELFVRALEAKPDYIKPNDVELAQYCNISGDITEDQIIEMAEKLVSEGIGHVAVSMGKEGAIFVSEDEKFMCKGLKVEAHSTVGAGDAMVAAISYGVSEKISFRDCARLGIATSAGAVMTKGTKPPTKETVDSLIGKVEFK